MIFKILESLGYKIDDNTKAYYNDISIWKELWKGYSPSKHDYFVTRLDHTTQKRQRKTLKMAKKVCEDWASMLLNNKTFVSVADDNSQIFLSGDSQEQNGGVFGLSKFWKYGNRLIEKAFACGTACFYLDLENPKFNGINITAENVRIKYIKDASMIVPLEIDNDDIVSIALVSSKIKNGELYYYVQTFIKEEMHYRISNYFYKINKTKFERADNFDGVVDSYLLPCKPFFIIRPNVENNVSDVAMGMSIYANSIDQIIGCDIAYDNLMNDVELGKKKIFIDQDCVATKKIEVLENGDTKNIEVPLIKDTLEQSLYIAMPSSDTDDGKEKKFFQEYTPDLRVKDNIDNIEMHLSLLSQGCRLGSNRYRFNKETMNTATEVKSSNSEMIENVNKERIEIEEALTEMTKSILILGKNYCGANVNPDAKISIKFDDTMFNDLDAERVRDLQEVSQGVMPKYKYIMKWQGLDETEAKKWVSDVDSETNESNVGSLYA